MRADGFLCNLEVLYGGLGIGKLVVLDPKTIKFFFSCIFFSIFGHQNPGSGLDPGPDRYSAYNAGFGPGSVSNEYGSASLLSINEFSDKM
jgi:hypothetical protein